MVVAKFNGKGSKAVFTLLKNVYCYGPENVGKKDIWIVYNKIHKIEDYIPEEKLFETQVVDCTGKMACPGFIDQHVHITGGGGEEGPVSRIPEIMLGDVISAGVTTLVGLLGLDAVTRGIQSLYAKAKALEEEGLTTFIYCGSYSVPTSTLTGKPVTDVALIDKVIGIGEVAISDYRSSHPTLQQLKELAWEAKCGALIGKKAGVVHIHVGDGKNGLNPVIELVRESDFPKEMFVPTHVNRNKKLFDQAVDYCKQGGNIDLTAGENSEAGYSVPAALEKLYLSGADMKHVTVSSDGNGSTPAKNGGSAGVGKVSALFQDIVACCKGGKVPMEIALQTVTSNVAKLLGIYPVKGSLQAGSDADILIMDYADLTLDKVFIKGQLFMDNGKIMKKGRYEVMED